MAPIHVELTNIYLKGHSSLTKYKNLFEFHSASISKLYIYKVYQMFPLGDSKLSPSLSAAYSIKQYRGMPRVIN